MTQAVQTSVVVTPNRAFAGMLADDAKNDTLTLRNADAVSMPFGAQISFLRVAPATEQDAILPAASTAIIAGTLVHKHNYARTFTLPDGTVAGELDSTGLVVGVSFAVLRQGRIWVICEDGCNPGDPLFIRYSGGTLGASRSTDAGGSTCLNATNQGTWLTKASAGTIAKLEVDFRNR